MTRKALGLLAHLDRLVEQQPRTAGAPARNTRQYLRFTLAASLAAALGFSLGLPQQAQTPASVGASDDDKKGSKVSAAPMASGPSGPAVVGGLPPAVSRDPGAEPAPAVAAPAPGPAPVAQKAEPGGAANPLAPLLAHALSTAADLPGKAIAHAAPYVRKGFEQAGRLASEAKRVLDEAAERQRKIAVTKAAAEAEHKRRSEELEKAASCTCKSGWSENDRQGRSTALCAIYNSKDEPLAWEWRPNSDPSCEEACSTDSDRTRFWKEISLRWYEKGEWRSQAYAQANPIGVQDYVLKSCSRITVAATGKRNTTKWKPKPSPR